MIDRNIELAFEMDLDTMCEILDDIINAFDKTDSITVVFSVLGTALDQWTADHGKTYEEVHEALVNLVEAHESVNAELGAMAESI